MENFIVSARKYRPVVFDNVVGQSHITTTLKNAIKDNHLAQALLFCGPRGVGKTTCARILAKAINCEKVTDTMEPCNTCASCTSFNSQSSFNVYELDAASNNSVEDIRALVEQVRYAPQAGQYKVYIIDEVHMLSNAAFNAFLKTLEEPPSYAIFILATTEKHKIIPTILSRCQIFDFHRIQPGDIVEQLISIAQQENITCEEEALHLIGQRADGALRDALSIFDLICTFTSGKGVTYSATLEHLHILDHAYYFQLIDAFLEQDMAKALLLYDEILKAGFDSYHFVAGLTEHLRNLMVCQKEASTILLATAEHTRQQYTAQSKRAGEEFLQQALKASNESALQYKGSYHKRLHVELLLIALSELGACREKHQAVTPLPSPTLPAKRAVPADSAAAPEKHTRDDSAESSPKSTAISHSKAPSTVTASSATQKEVVHPKQVTTPTTPPTASSIPAVAKPTTNSETMRLPQIDQIKQTLKIPSRSTNTAAPIVEERKVSNERTVTLAAIQEQCRVYAKNLQEAGKISEYNLLQQEIALVDNTIVIQLINAIQQDILVGMQDELMAYLRKCLGNRSLVLKGKLVQAPVSKKPYTAQEKFVHLAKKNPHLNTLQAALELHVQD